jgi:hypothetical protein
MRNAKVNKLFLESEMNSAERTIRIIDGEFTIDEIDWGDLSAADVKAGVADLLKHGVLIRNEGGAYQRTGKGDGEKGWWATSRAVQKLSSTGRRVFTVLVTLDAIRLMAEIRDHVEGATTEDIFVLLEQISAAYHGDMATAADHLRDGKVKVRRLWGE